MLFFIGCLGGCYTVYMLVSTMPFRDWARVRTHDRNWLALDCACVPSCGTIGGNVSMLSSSMYCYRVGQGFFDVPGIGAVRNEKGNSSLSSLAWLHRY